MESQILYESLTKPRSDLDSNMNKTSVNTPGNDDVKDNPETSVSESDKNVDDRNSGQPDGVIGNVTQSVDKCSTEVKSHIKSKLLEHLQSPIGSRNFSPNCDSENDVTSGNTKTVEPEAKSHHSNVEIDKKTKDTDLQSLVNIQSSDGAVTTNYIKQESSDLESPSPSMTSSNRSLSASPLPPPEVSSSKPLLGKSSKLHKRRRRGSAWTDAETEYLMEVWAKQTDIMKQKGGDESVTCAPVYRLISRSMADQGWEKTWEQCKTRIHTLKRAYKITKDEISEGCQTITYCRHFDKLEIICGDNPQITPGMLAAELEQKRKQRQAEGKSKKQPVRRKLTVGENPNLVKKANVPYNSLNISGFTQNYGQNSFISAQSVGGMQVTPSTNTIWYPPLQAQQPFQLQQQASADADQVQQGLQQSAIPSALQPSSQYPFYVTSGNNITYTTPYCSTAEINNNHIAVKTENSVGLNNEEKSNTIFEQSRNLLSQQTKLKTVSAPKTSSGNDLERMRLDLEMRKLEVERNKIEMEERQRREDRDHQYRMMQLLLFGLGQQNISQVLSGQGADVAHAHDAVLSRAIENGLLPGGSHKANEKGLSFSEL